MMRRAAPQVSVAGLLAVVLAVALNIWLFRFGALVGIVGLSLSKHLAIAWLCGAMGVDRSARPDRTLVAATGNPAWAPRGVTATMPAQGQGRPRTEEPLMTTEGSARLLLVEDEDQLRRLVAVFLRGSGFAVVEAADGPEALDRIDREGPFDLALVDLNLPRLSGVDVCRALRGRWPGHPVVICSAAVLREHEDALRDLGIGRYLTKPYHPEALLQTVAACAVPVA